ncbi:M10 family metallopeptidase [Neogemmobacter tilapiae]|uniref:Peptidase metallopeptidase domain-containing protein n=1 Tax=Neogemmobacter tilapiae TaxID=875041 RepID=A0A918TJA5_9RHOB|nr:M10 family metallopeptidase [Gemmobacter tilapiae]GHC48550.1 hypothetical protein GCM10007315_08220 [Gemmobacter tilapiae]
MCVLCAALHPDRAEALWQTHAGSLTAPIAAAGSNDAKEIADYLVKGYWNEAYPSFSEDHDPRRFDVSAGGELTYSFRGMSAAEKKIAKQALAAWTEVSGLTFREVQTGGDIRFRNDDPLNVGGGAYSYSQLDGWLGDVRKIDYSVISIDKNWDTKPISLNSYWFQTYVHEIGHALGLGHAGQYNGEGTIDREFKYDSWQLSVMSYVAQDENPNVRGEYAFLGSLMSADILAIQSIYGTDVRANHGNSTYGYKSNIGGPLGQMMMAWLDKKPMGRDVWQGNPMAFTVYDTGGKDVINLSKAFYGQRISLAEGAVSDFMGVRGGMVIAYGSTIENAIGGRGGDRFTGNDVANRLDGRGGHDRLNGQAGADLLVGSDGRDRLFGGADDDRLLGGAGDDVLNGGAGVDTAVFGGKAAIRLTLGKTGAQQTGNGRDSLLGVENVVTGGGNDRLTGNEQKNILNAGTGHDLLKGQGGDDRLLGGAGKDRLFGGNGNDTLLAGDDADQLTGGGGDDSLDGGSGSDLLKGDEGHDTLLGGEGADSLYGGAGNDRLTGGGGADVFRFGLEQDHVTDFTDDVDTLELWADLWGGVSLSVTEVLASYATVQAEGVVLNFGNGHVLTLEGLTDTAVLLNDIRIL